MCLDRNVDPLRLTIDGARAHPHHHAAGGALLGTRHRGPAVRVYPRQDEEVVVAPRRSDSSRGLRGGIAAVRCNCTVIVPVPSKR